jgi:subtilase family serine protease
MDANVKRCFVSKVFQTLGITRRTTNARENQKDEGEEVKKGDEACF